VRIDAEILLSEYSCLASLSKLVRVSFHHPLSYNDFSLSFAAVAMTANNLRIYGDPPFSVVVIHGGPGVSGTMASVARELATKFGILEPLQTAMTVEGQLSELHDILTDNTDVPATLIGSSWGAMLGFMFAARFPDLVQNLILVGSAVFEEKHANRILELRLSRLNETDQRNARQLLVDLQDEHRSDKDSIFRSMGELMTKADSFDPVTLDIEIEQTDFDLHCSVWSEAVALRRSGELLDLGKQIECPVLAIHGDYDPHQPEGIREPLSSVLKDFRFVILENCGHYPWIERRAKAGFYEIVQQETERFK